MNEPTQPYQPPCIQVVQVQVENGYASSAGISGVTAGDWGDGGYLGDYEIE